MIMVRSTRVFGFPSVWPTFLVLSLCVHNVSISFYGAPIWVDVGFVSLPGLQLESIEAPCDSLRKLS